MGAYSLDEIMKRWRKGELTAEQAIGQILQVMQSVSQRLGVVERRLAGQERNGGTAKQG